MSTLRRAQEHIAAVQMLLEDTFPTVQQLAQARLMLKTWEAHTDQTDASARRTAKALAVTAFTVSAWIDLSQASRLNTWTSGDTQELVDAVSSNARWQLMHAGECLVWWEKSVAEQEPSEDDQPDPVPHHGRIGGLARTVTIRHACGCEGTLTLTGCSDATWREALKVSAMHDCARHRIEKEQAALTTPERERLAKVLWECG